MLFAPETTELSFRHGDDVLVGDLVRPPWPGPYPAVVFVEGSGPGGRDQREWQTRLAADHDPQPRSPPVARHLRRR